MNLNIPLRTKRVYTTSNQRSQSQRNTDIFASIKDPFEYNADAACNIPSLNVDLLNFLIYMKIFNDKFILILPHSRKCVVLIPISIPRSKNNGSSTVTNKNCYSRKLTSDLLTTCVVIVGCYTLHPSSISTLLIITTESYQSSSIQTEIERG